jgi:hypothetical protein
MSVAAVVAALRQRSGDGCRGRLLLLIMIPSLLLIAAGVSLWFQQGGTE